MEEIANPFTFPPSQYLHYTKRNLVLLDLLRQRSTTTNGSSGPTAVDEQHRLLADQGDSVPEWDLTTLEPPRLDWIEEDGGYEAFGDYWPMHDRQMSLAEHGIMQLYENVPDHRPALRKLLQTVLSSYQDLLGALLVPPAHEPGIEQQPEFLKQIEWLRLNATNMIAAVNELRPVQARATLEMAMTKQLKSRRDATKAMHAKCDELEAQIASLQQLSSSSNLPPTQYHPSFTSRRPSIRPSVSKQMSSESAPPLTAVASRDLPPGLAGDDALVAWAGDVKPAL